MSDERNALLEDLRQEALAIAELSDVLLPEAFILWCNDLLAEAGELDDLELVSHRSRGIRVDACSFSDEGETLDLVAALYAGHEEPTTEPKRNVEAALAGLAGFFEASRKGLSEAVEASAPVHDTALRIEETHNDLRLIRLFLLTDGTVKSQIDPPAIEGFEVQVQVWDFERLYRLVSSGRSFEPIVVSAEEYGTEPIPILRTDRGTEVGYHAYLALIPGEFLARVYDRYGPRLLELNVRSFLQARGKVNRQIRDTLFESPANFLAFNNGITATAAAVKWINDPENGPVMTHLEELQIVNGGQTTASLHRALLDERADLSEVTVQAKIVVPADRDRLAKLVPLISRYSNSQNRVSEADFSSGHPFHVELENLSRRTWAPAPEGGTRQTRWFYERARGQYQDALGRERTAARRREFRAQHPTKQKITKTDLAKFENTWMQKPHIVSRGAQKNFRDFQVRLTERGKQFLPDDDYFRDLVAKTIVWRTTERLVSSLDLGGYRAQTVAYTLALLNQLTANRLDLDTVWKAQAATEALQAQIVEMAPVVHRHLVEAPGNQNVTEWAKKDQCWITLKKREGFRVLPDLEAELVKYGKQRKGTADDTTLDRPTEEEDELITWVMSIPAETWWEISSWAKATSNLQGWQRGIAYSLGKLVANDKPPSRKQAVQGRKLHDAALELGYQPSSQRHEDVED